MKYLTLIETNNTITNQITPETVQNMSNAIGIAGIKTAFRASSSPVMLDLFYDAISFAGGETESAGGGADIIQNVAEFLCGHMWECLTDTMTDGQTDKDGNTLTIIKGAFRVVHKTIYNHKNRIAKVAYIEDLEAEGEYIEIPFEWGVEDYTTFTDIMDIIERMKLTANQKAVLSMRLRGLGLSDIGRKRGVTKQAIENTLAKIGKRYNDLMQPK